jgi:uncharacterized Zn-finger protein
MPPQRPGSGSGHGSSPLQQLSKPILAALHPHRTPVPTSSATHLSSWPYASPAPRVSYTSPVDAPKQGNLYYARRPATANLQPRTPALISPVTPAWQQHHHHYFPPSSSAPYQQNHNRYVCRTCHKVLLRPSSLRIHTRTHTGEKPFRCTHSGCGQAFSVRSNMNRHERGCRSGQPAIPATLVA